MSNVLSTRLRTTTAALGVAALVAAPIAVAAPAHADGKDRDFRVAGAEVDFSVEKDDGRFEIEVDIDDAKPGSKWRITLKHDGRRYHKKVHRADRDGDVEIDKKRGNTKGADVFKVKVKKVGGASKSRTIRMR